ncbi:MAG: hypothetical protein RLZZ338_1040 [Cyanobacteriota bacterium]
MGFPHCYVKLHSNATLVLQISFHNQMRESLLLRGTLDDWVTDEEQIFSTANLLEPPYVYLFEEKETTQTITVQFPSFLTPGQRLKSWLRFPGVCEDAVLIEVEIVSLSDGDVSINVPLLLRFPPGASQGPEKTRSGLAKPVRSTNVSLPIRSLGSETLPLPIYEDIGGNSLDKTTEGIFGLLSGLMDLDKIPSSWLVAELLVFLAQKGEDYALTDVGSKLLGQLRQTRFFYHGSIALMSAHLPSWINNILLSEETVLGSDKGKYHLLSIWQQWLLSLVERDIEAPDEGKTILVSPFIPTKFVDKLGFDTGRWFGALLLGLAVVSPRMAQGLNAIAAIAPEIPDPKDDTPLKASYTLATGLPGLDAIPVRWLVLELLLIICQRGEQYSQTQEGCQLLTPLKRTRFFKNGLLAFATAQAPRWLAVSQSAASAYQAFLGPQIGQGGILYAWEQWLWSLTENQPSIPPPQAGETEAFLKAISIDVERAFVDTILGLSLVSPAIKVILNAIAAMAPNIPQTQIPPSPTKVSDVIGEIGTLQR